MSSVHKVTDRRWCEAGADLSTTGLQDPNCESLCLSFWFDREVTFLRPLVNTGEV